MIPSNKTAEELTNKFLELLGADVLPENREFLFMEKAKECAMLCVDEIWREMKSHDDIKSINYFQYAEVKSLINKI